MESNIYSIYVKIYGNLFGQWASVQIHAQTTESSSRQYNILHKYSRCDESLFTHRILFKNINIFMFPDRKSGFGGKFEKVALIFITATGRNLETVPVILCFVNVSSSGKQLVWCKKVTINREMALILTRKITLNLQHSVTYLCIWFLKIYENKVLFRA